MILQRTGHDFRRRRGAAIDQNDNRFAKDQIAGGGVEPVAILGVAAPGRHDLAALKKRVRDKHRLIQQPARVVAHVQHDAVDIIDAPSGGDLFGKSVCQVRECLVIERGHAQHNRFAFGPGAHGGQFDAVADDRQIKRIGRPFADNGNHNLGPDRTAHQVNCVLQRQAQHAFAIHRRDEIAGHHTSGIGGCAIHRRDDLDPAFLLRHLNPKAAKFAIQLQAHRGGIFGGHIAGMRVKRG